jgi:hypothetical protein
MPKTAFTAHLDAIKSGTVTKTNVIGLRKALNAVEREYQGWRTGHTSPKVTGAETEAALEALQEHRPIVTGELHETGLEQLQNRRYRRQLEGVADIIPNVARFRLVDFEMFGRRGDYAVPVYRAETEDGKPGFRFINIPWQSGGKGPEVL